MFAVLVAVALAQILGFLTARFAPPGAGAGAEYDDNDHTAVLRMAISLLNFAVPVAFFLGVTQLYARIAPIPGQIRRVSAVLASAMAWATLLLGLQPLAVILVGSTGSHDA